MGNRYQHYENKKTYELIGFAYHTETLEELVVYKSLYQSDDYGIGQIWVRPKKMFFENVNHEGKIVPRFSLIDG